MKPVVDIQRACKGSPDDEEIASWVSAALHRQLPDKPVELSVRIVDEAEIAALNTHYRNKPGPTNVLSFPFETPPGLPSGADRNLLLGDIVICAPVVEHEANEQGKSPRAHWAHMVIHGTLHLLGFDHQTNAEAEAMEMLEIELLHSLGIANPYQLTEELSSQALS